MERREELERKFEAMFGVPYADGLARFKTLLKRAINFERFAPGRLFDASTISMNERDFGIVAFFGCIGAGFIEELGLPALPPHEEEPDDQDVTFDDHVIDAEFTEISRS